MHLAYQSIGDIGGLTTTVMAPEVQAPPKAFFEDQTDAYKKSLGKTHWDFLLKEMMWMADDFEKESKKKQNDCKKYARNSKKHINEQVAL